MIFTLESPLSNDTLIESRDENRTFARSAWIQDTGVALFHAVEQFNGFLSDLQHSFNVLFTF